MESIGLSVFILETLRVLKKKSQERRKENETKIDNSPTDTGTDTDSVLPCISRNECPVR
jgi:hypothetical protein